MKKIVLIGFAACYKSTVGKLLADKLGCAFVDTDSEIERRTNSTTETILLTQGENKFREIESEVLCSLANRVDMVVSCGGGSVLCDAFNVFVKNSTVVWLTANAQTVFARLGTTPRPLFDNQTEQELEKYIERRSPIYAAHAHAQFNTDGKTPEQVANLIYNWLNQ